jgi:cell division cycle 20-like protein 1 (cofactor of APC complex)
VRLSLECLHIQGWCAVWAPRPPFPAFSAPPSVWEQYDRVQIVEGLVGSVSRCEGGLINLLTCIAVADRSNRPPPLSAPQVTKLCDLRSDVGDTPDLVTSVKWMGRGSLLAIGTTQGIVQIWDSVKCQRIRSMTGHSSRVGALAWNSHLLSSGSRDRKILQRDTRAAEPFQDALLSHKQEVCGLEWSPDEQHLASGGNDNKLFVWKASYTQPAHRFSDHTAAVKAIAWSPHQHGLLASGGGTADQCIRFWNTLTSQPLQSVFTKSQVCNLAWAKNSNELVSTHGYSQNQIVLWRYPSMTQIATLTGHTYRVLYLAMSPDGQTIVTGAGDETLRFWNVFSKSRSPKQSKSVLNLFTHIR